MVIESSQRQSFNGLRPMLANHEKDGQVLNPIILYESQPADSEGTMHWCSGTIGKTAL
jgi:hypothetical protein